MTLVYLYGHGFMAFPRRFRNGNSLAARIPAELEQEQEQELDIKRVGDALRRVAEV